MRGSLHYYNIVIYELNCFDIMEKIVIKQTVLYIGR